MNILDYYDEMRSDIWKIITGTKNADSYCWDETTPNRDTRKWLRFLILGRYLSKASQFGLYMMTVYENCDRPYHRNFSNLPNKKKPIEIGDKRFEWYDFRYTKEIEYTICPCNFFSKIPSDHYVYYTAFFYKRKSTELPSAIGSILSDVAMAIANAGDKMPRSGIREYLLRSIIKIDNEKMRILSVDGKQQDFPKG